MAAAHTEKPREKARLRTAEGVKEWPGERQNDSEKYISIIVVFGSYLKGYDVHTSIDIHIHTHTIIESHIFLLKDCTSTV